MNLTTIIILVIIGLMAGVFGGIFGVGGAVIMIPAMVYFLNMNQHTAQGTSLAVMLPPIGLFAAYNYYKAGQVNIWYAMIIAVSFMIGGYFGSKIALNLPEQLMKKVFAVFLILVALRMLLSKQAGVLEQRIRIPTADYFAYAGPNDAGDPYPDPSLYPYRYIHPL